MELGWLGHGRDCSSMMWSGARLWGGGGGFVSDREGSFHCLQDSRHLRERELRKTTFLSRQLSLTCRSGAPGRSNSRVMAAAWHGLLLLHDILVHSGVTPAFVFLLQYPFELGLTAAFVFSTLVCLSRLYTGMHTVLVRLHSTSPPSLAWAWPCPPVGPQGYVCRAYGEAVPSRAAVRKALGCRWWSLKGIMNAAGEPTATCGFESRARLVWDASCHSIF